MKSRRALTALVAAACLAASPDAAAWYFPEHIVIAKDALVGLPPEIREILRAALATARAEGLALCEQVDAGLEDLPRTKPLRTRMLLTDLGVDCVPYTALPAMAGDHANGARELRAVVAGQKGLELTSAAAYEWDRFRDAVAKLPYPSLERMSFVHELDVDFYFIDPGYEVRAQATRAHFADAGKRLEDVVSNVAVAGAVDNAVGQFLAHHVRSLELAARGRTTEAVLEHGLAVHFLQDGFSAGHLVMTERDWARGNTHARRRHDFFDAKGLHVGRATSAQPCSALRESFESGLLPCWTTMGDGYLGLTEDASDRVHVARAVKKAELAFAIALAPDRVTAMVERLGEREQIAVGELVDPMPWWTLRPSERRKRPESAAHATALVRGAAAAVLRLREGAETPEVDVGGPPRGRLFGERIVANALDPCVASDGSGDADEAGCGPGRVLAIGSVGASLIRPLLVELPTAAEDVTTMEGEAPTDHGFALQLFAGIGGGAVFPRRARLDLFAPSASVAMGIAYRFGTYLPGRRNRSGAEVNVGISEAVHYDSHGDAGGNPNTTMLDQELRWPIVWESFTSYVLPLDLRRSKEAGSIIVLGGGRLHEILVGPTPRLWGFDVEAIAFSLWNSHGTYPIYSAAPEIRVHFGFADASAAQPSLPGGLAPTFGVVLTGGYATFL